MLGCACPSALLSNRGAAAAAGAAAGAFGGAAPSGLQAQSALIQHIGYLILVLLNAARGPQKAQVDIPRSFSLLPAPQDADRARSDPNR